MTKLEIAEFMGTKTADYFWINLLAASCGKFEHQLALYGKKKFLTGIEKEKERIVKMS